MRRFFTHVVTQDTLDPQNILPECGFANPGETHPHSSVIQWKQATAPAKQRLLSIDLLQVNDLVNLQGAGVCDYDSSVYGGEVKFVIAQQAVMRRLRGNIDPASRIIQGDRIALTEAREI